MSRNIVVTQFLARSSEPQKHCYLDQGTVLIFPRRHLDWLGRLKKSSWKALFLLTTRDSLYSVTSVALLLKGWSKTNATLYLLRFTTSQPNGAKCKLQHIHLYSTSIPGSVIPLPSPPGWIALPALPCWIGQVTPKPATQQMLQHYQLFWIPHLFSSFFFFLPSLLPLCPTNLGCLAHAASCSPTGVILWWKWGRGSRQNCTDLQHSKGFH